MNSLAHFYPDLIICLYWRASDELQVLFIEPRAFFKTAQTHATFSIENLPQLVLSKEGTKPITDEVPAMLHTIPHFNIMAAKTSTRDTLASHVPN